MADELKSERIRREAGEKHKEIVKAFEAVSKEPGTDRQICAAIQAVGVVLTWSLAYLPEIASQLAEANERDREAEIRAKNAEAFVAGIQAELARQQIVIPGGVLQVKPPRGR
jgi:hypothetical protein